MTLRGGEMEDGVMWRSDDADQCGGGDSWTVLSGHIVRLFWLLSTDQPVLLVHCWLLVKLLVPIYAAYYLLRVYIVPTNRVKGLEAFGVVRGDHFKLSHDPCQRASHVNQVRDRQKRGLMPPPFPNGWFAVMDSDQLSASQVAPLNVLGLELVIFRTQTGIVHILDSICPHLGASLTQGVVQDECIECPFHRWRFEGTSGRVACVPYSAQSKESVGKFGVTSWPVHETNGTIHLWHHAEGEPPHWWPPEQAGITSQHLLYCGQSQHTVAAHIQDLPENGADPAHLAAIHQRIFVAGNSVNESCGGWWMRQLNLASSWLCHTWSACWTACSSEQHRAHLHIETTFRAFNRLQLYSSSVHVQQVGPGLVYMKFNSPLGNGLIIQMVTPQAALRQSVVHKVFWNRYYGLGVFVAKFHLLVESIQFERDVRIWNQKNHLVRPCLVKEDSSIGKYRRWFSQFYSQNSRRPFESVDSADF